MITEDVVYDLVDPIDISYVYKFQRSVRVVMVMVFNATFNNISIMSWPTVLLVEETEVPG